ncbi:MAG: helix-turn-helix domain-containing protein [Gordonia paraffinivorans]
MTTTGHRTLIRADRILDHVARCDEPPTLSDIARGVGAPVSSTQDLVRELCALGYLVAAGRRYRLGLRPHVLALIAGGASETGVEHAELQRLSRVAGAPIGVAALVGRDIFYLDHAGPRAPARTQLVADEHQPRPVLRTSAGRLLLACADEPVRERVLSVLEPDDPEGAARFRRDVGAIRRHRTARSDGLADPGIAAIAIPAVDGTAFVLTARRAPRGGRVPSLEVAARRLRLEWDRRTDVR